MNVVIQKIVTFSTFRVVTLQKEYIGHCGVTLVVQCNCCMMEEQDILDQMSGDHSGSNQETTTTDDHTVHLPAYLAYLSLWFKAISTMIIVVMAGWIIVTIKTTRSLHKIHNIYVAHLMATDVIYVLIRLAFNGLIIIGYFIGKWDHIGCHVSYFFLFPFTVAYFTYAMISVDKVITITFPLRYHQIMKPRVVVGIITTKWVVAIMLFSYHLFNPNGFIKVAKFGACGLKEEATLLNFMTIIVPIYLACLLTILLNIYLTIKAYKVHKQIQEESKLSGGHTEDNDQLRALKKKQATIKKHRKPMITLLVVVLGSSSSGLLFPLLLIPTLFLEDPTVYEKVMQYVVAPNIIYFSLLLHPFVYGLYFKQVREPMMRSLKRITCLCKCNSTAVAPEPQRNRITWMNPN